MSSFSQPKCKSPSIHNLNNEIKKINIDILKNNNAHNIKTQNAISNMLDVINDNNLNLFYKDGTSKFKYNIDQLNLKFYLETEKILSSTQSDLSHNQNRLFLILFKQITLYIKEIERLNLVLIEESKNPSYLKKKVSFIEKQKLEFETKENLIQSLKNSISLLEKKLSNAIISENQIREESEKLKKEVKYYKQLYQQCIGISPKKTIDNDSKRKSKRTYSDNNQSGSLYNGNVNINNSQNKTEINLYDKSLYNKSTSKLKIIKTVKNKISYSNNSKKSFNNQNINNFNNTQKDNSNLNIYNCNSNSNSASNHSSNNIIDDNNNNNKNKTPKSGFNSNKISHKNISIKRESNNNKEIRELNKLENLLLDIKNYIKNENSYLNIHSVKFFNNNNNKTRNLNENMFFNKKNITVNNSAINPRFINPKKKLSSNGALDNKIM